MTEISHNDQQEQIQQYMQKFHIEEILGDLIKTLASTMDPNPITFMIKYLSNLCSSKELVDSGITITGPTPTQNLALLYPTFKKNNKNLFKAHLTPEVFLQVKSRRTDKNVTLRELLSAALENEEHPVGVFALDRDTYNVFSDIFDPILKAMNEISTIEPYEPLAIAQLDDLLMEGCSLTDDENQMLEKVTLKVKRNLSGFSLNPTGTTTEREDIIKVVTNALGEMKEELLGVYNWGKSWLG